MILETRCLERYDLHDSCREKHKTIGTTVSFRHRTTLYKFSVLERIDTDGKSQETGCVQVRDRTSRVYRGPSARANAVRVAS